MWLHVVELGAELNNPLCFLQKGSKSYMGTGCMCYRACRDNGGEPPLPLPHWTERRLLQRKSHQYSMDRACSAPAINGFEAAKSNKRGGGGWRGLEAISLEDVCERGEEEECPRKCRLPLLLILDGRQGGHRNPAEKEAGASKEVALMGEGHVKCAVMLNTDTFNPEYDQNWVMMGLLLFFTCTLTHAKLERAGFMAYAAASHQGVVCWFCFSWALVLSSNIYSQNRKVSHCVKESQC